MFPCLDLLLIIPILSDSSTNLVKNPNFATTENWVIWNPIVNKASCSFTSLPEGILIESPNRPYAVGGLCQEIKEIKGNTAYSIKASCKIKDIHYPYRSIAIRFIWTKDGRPISPAGFLIRGPIIEDDIARFDDILVAPEEANGAVVYLDTKWLEGGAMIWKNASIAETDPIPPRMVKIGTVFLRPSNSTIENNLKLWCEKIDEAGKLGLDILCLGEMITMIGTSANIVDCAQPIPGHDTDVLGDFARKNKIWIIAGLSELDGDSIYNTAVLLDREGKVAGKYRKVHLPREEWNLGTTPGHEYPVFQTDFGTIAIQICYDWFFPEIEAIFALQGAEIIFAPTWGNTLPDHDGIADGENIFRTRSRDNGVYMVPSVYDGNSLVIDPMGRILASNNGQEGVFWAEVDLNKREELDWVGYWRSIGPRHRMTHTYAPLMDYPPKPTY